MAKRAPAPKPKPQQKKPTTDYAAVAARFHERARLSRRAGDDVSAKLYLGEARAAERKAEGR